MTFWLELSGEGRGFPEIPIGIIPKLSTSCDNAVAAAQLAEGSHCCPDQKGLASLIDAAMGTVSEARRQLHVGSSAAWTDLDGC